MVEPSPYNCIDKPELETLDKRPSIRVNKADNASQPTEQPKRVKPLGYPAKEQFEKLEPLLDGRITEQPNPELMIVKTIQGLTSAINNELSKLNELTKFLSCNRNSLVLQALEDIDMFEKQPLSKLQHCFE